VFELDEISGNIKLSDTVFIAGNMSCEALEERLQALTGKPCYTDDPKHPATLLSGTFDFADMGAACVCRLHANGLCAMELHVIGGSSEAQRDALFHCLGQEETCLERKRSVLFRFPFGTAWIAADQRSGDTTLRITYAGKE